MKRLMQIALLALVALGLGQWALERVDRGSADAVAEGASGAPAARADGIVITYFTTDVRCQSCLTIERLTRAAVEQGYADEIARGRVHFEIRNLDRPGNMGYARDYDLSFKTVVISEWRDGEELRWQRMDDVWRLLGDADAFRSYLARQIDAYLGARPDTPA